MGANALGYAGLGNLAGSIAALLLAGAAQAASESVAEGQSAVQRSDALEEIVVTANKRSQVLQEVGVTADVLSASQLAERRISTLGDIAEAVPSLSYSASENNTPVFTLRGIGFNEAALATYPTVSVYVDETPLPFPVMSQQGAFDLQRIEVLKGPQGTLYGENSTGGAINYIAAKPTSEFSAGQDLSYGRFNTVELNGFVSGPISDTLKGRVAIHAIHRDAWQRSYTSPNELGKSEAYAARAMLDWTPRTDLRFNFVVTAWKDKSDPQAGQLVAIDQQVPPGAKAGVTNYPYPPNDNRAADWSHSGPSPSGSTVGFDPFSDRTFYQATFRGDVDLSDNVVLTSLTSYARFKQRQAVDYDGIALNDDDIPLNDGTIRTFYEELRLTNGNSSGFRWIVGGNYQDSHIHEDDAITYSDGSTSFPGLNNIYENGFRSDTDRKDYAAFGNVEIDVAPRFTAIAGARYTHNRTSTDICNYDLGDGHVAALITGLGSLLTGQQLPALGPDDCVTLGFDNIPGPHYVNTLSEDNVSWRAGLNYKPSKSALLYLTVSRGYKAGSYPTISASSFRQYIPVTQESVAAYETGLKTSFLDRRLTFNAAAYYYEYKDKQIRGKVLDPVFGVLNALVNVPRSHLYGAEAEVRARPIRGLEVGATVTYVASRVDEYTGTNVVGGQGNLAGNTIPFAPKWQSQFDVQYKWDAGRVSPFVGADVSSRSKATTYIGGESIIIPQSAFSSTAPGVAYPFAIDPYTLVNLRAGISWADGKWQAMIWGKNVFNRYYWQNSIYAFDTGFRFAGRPAMYGVTLSSSF